MTLVVCLWGSAQQPKDHKISLSEPKVHKMELKDGENPEIELQTASSLRKKLTRRDLRAAIGLFADSVRRFIAIGETGNASFAQLQVGDSFQMMSDYPDALAAYQSALKLSHGEGEAQCSALVHIVRTYANIGRHEQAERYLKRATDSCGGLDNKRAMASLLEAQGEVEFWSGNAKPAMDALSRARALAEEIGDKEVNALSTMIAAEIAHGSDIKQGNLLARTSMEMWRNLGDEYGVARAAQIIAFFAVEEGDFSRAQCHCDKALSVFRRIHDTDNEAVMLNNRGLIARSLGDLDGALKSYSAARREFASVHDDLGVADSIDGMVDVLEAKKRFDPILRLYESETRLGNTTKNRSFLAAASMATADVDRRHHNYEAAEREYARSAMEYETAGNSYGKEKAYTKLADMLIEERHFRDALPLLDASEKIARETGEKENSARLGYLRSLIDYDRGELEASLKEIEKTAQAVESQRLRIARFDSRAQYFAFIHDYFSLYIQILMTMDARHPKENYAKWALEVAERSKVRTFLDMLEEQKALPSCDELEAGDSDSPFNDDDSLEVEPARTTHAMRFDELQAEISDNRTVLVEYAIGNLECFAWLLDGTTMVGFDLGNAAKIRSSADSFRRALLPLQKVEGESPADFLLRRQRAKKKFSAELDQLSRLLLGQIHAPQGKRLVIVPDGALQGIPFDVLIDSEPHRAEISLVRTNEIAIEPSVSVLAVLRKIANSRPPPRNEVAVFADPVFEYQAGTAPSGSPANQQTAMSHALERAIQDLGHGERIPPLPGSRREALAIQKIVGPNHTRLALGLDANRDSIVNGSLSEDRVVHFATHGILDTRNPEASGLILSLFDRRGKRRDGYLRLADIYNLRLKADLIVLSSCESASGRNLGSEGVIGLPRGFLYAGARTVIASLWKVDDDATAVLMRGLYARMKQGESASAALRGAKLELLATPRYSDPSYWAAFVLEGEYK